MRDEDSLSSVAMSVAWLRKRDRTAQRLFDCIGELLSTTYADQAKVKVLREMIEHRENPRYLEALQNAWDSIRDD